VVLFFVPVVNLFYFAILCIIPPKRNRTITGMRKSSTDEYARIALNQREPASTPILDYGYESMHPIQAFITRFWPESKLAAGALAILIPVPVAVVLTVVGVELVRNYGWGLFVGLPFSLAFSSALLFAIRDARSAA